ncbi:NAD(P)H-binding protein [Piscinibacter sp.]|uniref:NAD(P)H-binding protein n=1 Tax=Piscinibacter sp. TaxID=1903157 RepID=UPI0039E41A93
MPNPPRTVLLAGATGLVGRALLAQLLEHPGIAHVHVLLRRAAPSIAAHPKLELHVVDFAHLRRLPRVDDVYIALGTTLKAAGSESAFRQVDHGHVIAVARAAREAGARRLAVVSALGADAGSRVFYNRVKGEMEADAAALGYDEVCFAQPSLLLGDRAALGQPQRPAEAWAGRLLGPVARLLPRGVRPIRADDVAAALIAATLAGKPGVHRLASARMHGALRR